MKKVMARSKKKGQSTLEYIILVAGMTAMLIVFFKSGGTFEASYKNVFRERKSDMGTIAERSYLKCAKPGDQCINWSQCCSADCDYGTGICQ